jgi:hypothetical protein
MPNVKWDVVPVLSKDDDLLAEGVANAQFVKHVWIAACHIGHNQTRGTDGFPDVFNYFSVVEDFSCMHTAKTRCLGGWQNGQLSP